MSLIKHFADGPDSWSLMKQIADAKRVITKANKDIDNENFEEAKTALTELLKKLNNAY